MADWIGYNQRLKTENQRFFEKIAVVSSGCWEWQGGRQKKGYGIFRFNNGYLAHRFSYQLAYGPIPDGLLVDHKCQNKCCVNPTHLRLVDNVTNIYENSTHYATRIKCSKGHEYTKENTMLRSDGGRRCRICDNARHRGR